MARPGFPTHPKLRRLMYLLQIGRAQAVGHCELMWSVAYDAGNEIIGDAIDVELAAEWLGTPGDFTKAMLDVGLIDRLDDGRHAVHDLFDHAPEYVQKRRERELARREKGKTRIPFG